MRKTDQSLLRNYFKYNTCLPSKKRPKMITTRIRRLKKVRKLQLKERKQVLKKDKKLHPFLYSQHVENYLKKRQFQKNHEH